MKRIYIWLVSVLSAFLYVGGTEASLSPDDFAEWSEERFQAYNDSLYDALYPTATICEAVHELRNTESTPLSVQPLTSNSTSVSRIDTSKEVGEIKIVSSITPTGARGYEVPIDLYPGMNGMTPSLAFVYNSQGGNSFMGCGWTLSGLRTISRASKTIYHDGKTAPVKREVDDSFVIDGMRLVRLSGNNRSISYESEQGNIKVKGFRNDSIITHFEVYYPDGTKGVFGYPETTRREIYYPMTELSDLMGNTICYEYKRYNNFYYITEIRYNNDLSIEFEYLTNRPDMQYIRVAGYQAVVKWLLKSVTTKMNSTVLSCYGLTYDTKYYRSVLTEIGYTSNGKSLNPLKFSYGSDGNIAPMYKYRTTYNKLHHHSTSTQAIRLLKGRFDPATGNEGLITLRNYNPYFKNYRKAGLTHHSTNKFTNKYDELEQIYVFTNLTGEITAPIVEISAGKGFIDVLCADLHGSYEDCIIKVNSVPVSNTDEVLTFEVYENSAKGLKKTLTRSYQFPTVTKDGSGNKSIQPKYFYPGDFDGDGKMEIFAVSAHHALGDESPVSSCYLFDLIEDKVLYNQYKFSYSIEFVGSTQPDPVLAEKKSDKLFVTDCDGDGKTDVCLFNSTGFKSYTFDAVNDSTMTMRKLSELSIPQVVQMKSEQILPCDLDGDGISDFITFPKEGNKWNGLVGDGTGAFRYSTRYYEPLVTPNDSTTYFVADVNGDGVPDINCVVYDENNSGLICSYIIGGDFVAESLKYGLPRPYTLISPVNLNSPSVHSPLLGIMDQYIYTFEFLRNDSKETMISSMTNSLGMVGRNQYEILHKTSSVYEAGKGASFPYVNISEPLVVLSEAKMYVDGKPMVSDKYAYKNAVMHLHGLGFRGFGEMTVTDIKGHSTSRTFDPYNYGVLKSEKSPETETSYKYSVLHFTQGKTKILLTQKYERDLLRNISSTTTYSYDAHGYPINETCQINGYGDVVTTTKYQHNPTDAAGYYLGLVTESEVVTSTKQPQPISTLSRKVTTTYSNGLPVRIRNAIDDNQEKEVSYTYDSFGNPLSVSTKLYSSSNLQTTKYDYDKYGRVVKTTDPIGLSEEYSYDDYGRRSTIKDVRGNLTTFVFDAFGREVSELAPDGTVSKTDYEWTSEASQGRLFTKTETCTGLPTKRTTYDALGRKVEDAELRFDGSWLKTVTEYDVYGNISRVSAPTKQVSPVLWSTYTYDEYDRLLSLTEPTGRKITNTYEENSVITVKDGQSSTRYYNPRGELIELDDPVGWMYYTLHADGQPIRIETPDGEYTDFEYDEFRRRIKVTDPNSDTVEYTYDDAGNVRYEDVGGFFLTSYEYDKYNRLKVKTLDVTDFNYSYDEFGELSQIECFGYKDRDIVYDSFGRISSTTDYGNGTWLRKDYKYSGGNISSVTYTSDQGELATESYVYSNGHLTEIKLNGSDCIYKLTAENDLGQTSQLSTGIFDRKYGFTSAGLPLSREAFCTGLNVQDLTYVFQEPHYIGSVYNLTSRTNNVSGRTEQFRYDAENRLIEWGDKKADYDMMGNIVSRSDVGKFYYDILDKPYAVSEIELNSDSISLPVQSISYWIQGHPDLISENGISTRFSYNSDADRVEMYVRNGRTTLLRRHYLGGCYEYDRDYSSSRSEERLYLGGDYYNAHAVLVKNSDGEELYYLFRDYLGSITQICKADGTLVQELEYSPWGEIALSDRTPDASAEAGSVVPLFGRGFTGHEHIPWHGLVNMNARLYDPMVGRFLSPDPLVQTPDYSQNYNRFSYALNNPLCYVDEDGEFIWAPVLIGALIGGTTNLMANWMDVCAAGGGWKSVWKGLGYFATGGLAGAASGAIAGAIPSVGVLYGALSGACSGAANSLLLGMGNTLVSGGSFSSALEVGAKDAVFGAMTGAMTGSLEGAANAYTSGKNIWTGKDIQKSVVVPELSLPRESMQIPLDDIKYLEERRGYSTYYGRNKVTKEIEYVGMTARDPNVRFREHLLSNSPRSKLEYEVVNNGTLTKMEARIWEQKEILKFGMIKNGGQLHNLRNEISPRLWPKYGITQPKMSQKQMTHNIFLNLKN